MAKKQPAPQPETEGTELALFPKLNLPAVTHITEQMNATFKTMFTRIEEDIAHLPDDMSDPKNRERVASFAYRISRTKTGLDAAAAGVASEAKQIVDSVNAERRTLKETLDSLRDKAREKLTAWEQAEEAKRQHANEAIARFQNVAFEHQGKDSGELSMILDNLKAWQFKEEHYGERAADVKDAHFIAVERLKEMLAVQQKYEHEQAELEQFRREKAEREAAEAARIAEEERKAAEAAEVARQEAERARIAQEAEEKAKREAAEAIEAAKREAAEAEERHHRALQEAEAARVRDAEEAKRREIEQEEARAAAAARAEEDAKRREEEAREAERQRIAREQAARDQADRERAADIAHRKKLNGEAVAGLVKACGLSEKEAQAVIIAIYKEQVPHVAINY